MYRKGHTTSVGYDIYITSPRQLTIVKENLSPTFTW